MSPHIKCTLHPHRSSLKLSELELKRIADEQGANAINLVELVKENEEILDTMKVSIL